MVATVFTLRANGVDFRPRAANLRPFLSAPLGGSKAMARKIMPLFLTLFFCTAVNGDPVIHKFEYWGKMNPVEKIAFYYGWTNGFLPGRGTRSLELADCLENISADQALAMIDKQYKEHPEKWGSPIGLQILETLTASGSPCEGKNPLEAAPNGPHR